MLLFLQMIDDIFDGPFLYTQDCQTISLQCFQDFLIVHQKDLDFIKDLNSISDFISSFIQDPQREIQELYLTIPEVSIIAYGSMCWK